MNAPIAKIPHVQQVRIDGIKNQSLLLSRIAWTQDQYNDFQYQAGLQFLETLCFPHEKLPIESSFLFWKWWRHQWLIRDQELYDGILLTPKIYQAMNTPPDLLTTEQPLACFKARIGEFLRDGEKLLKKRKEPENGI